MKTIKHFLLTFLFAGLILATACRKYEEGPSFSLRSKTARVSNNWKVGLAHDYRNNVDVTVEYAGETWEFTKDGDFIERNNGSVDNQGTWAFISDKDSIAIKVGLDVDKFAILKLRENEFWLKDKEEELHLIPVQ